MSRDPRPRDTSNRTADWEGQTDYDYNNQYQTTSYGAQGGAGGGGFMDQQGSQLGSQATPSKVPDARLVL